MVSTAKAGNGEAEPPTHGKPWRLDETKGAERGSLLSGQSQPARQRHKHLLPLIGLPLPLSNGLQPTGQHLQPGG